MYASIMQLDPNQASKQWVAYISDTMQLLVLHELEPQIAAPLLTAHMTHVVGWLLAFYYFNTNGEAGRVGWPQHAHRPAGHPLQDTPCCCTGSHVQLPTLVSCTLRSGWCACSKAVSQFVAPAHGCTLTCSGL
jgi:hypothetical protein